MVPMVFASGGLFAARAVDPESFLVRLSPTSRMHGVVRVHRAGRHGRRGRQRRLTVVVAKVLCLASARIYAITPLTRRVRGGEDLGRSSGR